MRALSLQKFDIVWRGDEWRFEASPSSRDAVNLLENNEAVVSWLAPKNQSHDPCAQVHGKSLSLLLVAALRQSLYGLPGASHLFQRAVLVLVAAHEQDHLPAHSPVAQF